MKTSVHYRLSDEALAAISHISKATGLSATAVVEMTMREAAKRMDIRERLGHTVTFDRIEQVLGESAPNAAADPTDIENLPGAHGVFPPTRSDILRERAALERAENSMSPEAKEKRAEKKAAKQKRQTEGAKQVSGFLSHGGVKPCEHGYRADLCRTEKCRRGAQVS